MNIPLDNRTSAETIKRLNKAASRFLYNHQPLKTTRHQFVERKRKERAARPTRVYPLHVRP